MDWTELSLNTNALGAEVVSEYLCANGAKGTQIIDRADIPDPDKPHGYWELIDPMLLDDMPESVVVKAWFPKDKDILSLLEGVRTLPALCGFDLGSLSPSYQQVAEKDWSEYWKQFYKPFRMGQRLVVKPSWEDYQAEKQDLVMELDPGMAFGTGSHETTALCVELIEQYAAGGSFLDIGTGSGILSIAAAKLGVQPITAVDIDPVAVEVARENVRRNGLDKKITVIQGDLTQGLDGVYDMAVANILADVILILLPSLRLVLKPGGIFLCSGVIKDREQDVLDGLQQWGYTVLTTRQKKDWCAIAAKRDA